jgi:hypothetical protein
LISINRKRIDNSRRYTCRVTHTAILYIECLVAVSTIISRGINYPARPCMQN